MREYEARWIRSVGYDVDELKYCSREALLRHDDLHRPRVCEVTAMPDARRWIFHHICSKIDDGPLLNEGSDIHAHHLRYLMLEPLQVIKSTSSDSQCDWCGHDVCVVYSNLATVYSNIATI